VASVMTLRIVDRLQAVDVDDHHRTLAAVAGAEGNVLIELGAETAPVEQPSERVVISDVAELGLGFLRSGKRFLDHPAIVGGGFGEHRLDRRIALRRELLATHPGKVELSAPTRSAAHALAPRIGTNFSYPATPKSQSDPYGTRE